MARSAGMSAWQFIAPAVVVAFALGVFATTIYNPMSALLRERSKKFESELFGRSNSEFGGNGNSFWASQRNADGLAIINAKSSRDQGVELSGVTVFTFDNANHFRRRIEARAAVLDPGRVAADGCAGLPARRGAAEYARVQAEDQPDTGTGSRKFCELRKLYLSGNYHSYIKIAEHAGLVAAGYRLQFQKLLARPFMLAAMVFIGGRVQSTIFPLRRYSEDGFKWRGGRLSALCFIESNR